MRRWDYFAVAFLAEDYDKPHLVVDLLVRDALGHVIGSRVAVEGQGEIQ